MSRPEHPYGHVFTDRPTQPPPGDAGSQQNILHGARGGVMGGNEYRVLNMPRAHVWRNAALNANVGNIRIASFDRTAYDTDSMVDQTNFPTRITCKTPGIYAVTGCAIYDAVLNDQLWTRIVYNNNSAQRVASDTARPAWPGARTPR